MDDGIALLERHLTETDTSRAAFARRAGLHASTIQKILDGDRHPDLHTALAIASASDGAVPIESWPKPERKTAAGA